MIARILSMSALSARAAERWRAQRFGYAHSNARRSNIDVAINGLNPIGCG
jgi:hypothetical protein